MNVGSGFMYILWCPQHIAPIMALSLSGSPQCIACYKVCYQSFESGWTHVTVAVVDGCCSHCCVQLHGMQSINNYCFCIILTSDRHGHPSCIQSQLTRQTILTWPLNKHCLLPGSHFYKQHLLTHPDLRNHTA